MATLADVRKLAAFIALLDRPDEPEDQLVWSTSFENDKYARLYTFGFERDEYLPHGFPNNSYWSYLQSMSSFDHECLFSRVHMASRSLIQQSRASIAKRRERNLRAPIFVLPIEILSEIALLAMLPLGVSIWKSPVLATCTRWRACIINTPRIWSHVYITQGELAAERQECWLQRAGGGVFLDLTVDDAEAFRKLEASWIKTPSLRTPKVKSLIFSSKFNHHIQPSPFPIRFDATYLRELEVTNANCREGDRPAKLFEHQTPQCLHRLKLISLVGPGSLLLSGWDSSSLVSLNLLDEIPNNDVLNILANASQLERLMWSYCDEKTSMDSHAPIYEGHTIRLNKLKSLDLSDGSSDGGIREVLPMLEAPALEKFCFTRTGYTDNYRTFARFAARWPTLTHLWLHDYAEDYYNEPATEAQDAILAVQVASVLHALPKLEFFNATWCDVNIQGLLALCGDFPTHAKGDRSEWACPSPRRLCLPLHHSLRDSILSHELLSECLNRLLDARGHSGLILVLDVPIDTLQLLVDKKWIESGAVEIKSSLVFRDE
ncbi:hypothetical protein DL93DRAFT_2225525 [Clavulina sp. PMI_390]|nr:hypothetical protein DL93DRAFT_2225525 [Clavulina sp. PMI_390]